MNTLYETMADGRRGLSVNDANATLGGGLRAASIVSGSRATGTLARGVPALALAAALGLGVTAGEAWGEQVCTSIDAVRDTNGVAISGGQIYCGEGASAVPDFAIAFGNDASATENSAIAVGHGATATGADSTAIGYIAEASGNGSTAIGDQAKATQAGAFASGQVAQALGQRSFAIGDYAIAEGTDSFAMGTRAHANGTGAIAMGNEAQATGAGAAAIGDNAQASVAGAVAVGKGSKATRQAGAVTGVTGYDILTNTNALLSSVSEPAEVWRSTEAAYAVGNEATETRNIINMAAGSDPTDGVNVAQLKRLEEAIADHHFYISANGKRSGVYGEDTITFVGDDNIFVDLNGQTISVQLNPNLTADSVTINDGGPVMNEGGINMSNRPITNVADGRNPHDAVNRGQLDGMDGRLRAGIAGAVAQANIPQVMTPGAYMLGAGLGHSKNRLALGVGWSARSDNGHWVLRNSVGMHDDAASFGAGVGYEF